MKILRWISTNTWKDKIQSEKIHLIILIHQSIFGVVGD